MRSVVLDTSLAACVRKLSAVLIPASKRRRATLRAASYLCGLSDRRPGTRCALSLPRAPPGGAPFEREPTRLPRKPFPVIDGLDAEIDFGTCCPSPVPMSLMWLRPRAEM